GGTAVHALAPARCRGDTLRTISGRAGILFHRPTARSVRSVFLPVTTMRNAARAVALEHARATAIVARKRATIAFPRPSINPQPNRGPKGGPTAFAHQSTA